MTHAQVLKNALKLDPIEQERLLAELSKELFGEDGPPMSDEWRAELHRRAHELRTGKVKGIPSAEVHRTARAMLARRRASK